MTDRNGQQAQQHDPRTEPLPLAGLDALDRLARALQPSADAVTVYETAGRYRLAADHYKALAECGDYAGCEYVRDEMAMCACQLADAGRLDLIGANA